MTDYRKLFNKEYLGHWDLPEDRDAVVTIANVESGELHNPGKKADKKPILTFEGKEKRMVCNATNAKTIAAMYGNHVEQWIGKKVALFRTTTHGPSGQVECVRVRPQPPKEANKTDAATVEAS